MNKKIENIKKLLVFEDHEQKGVELICWLLTNEHCKKVSKKEFAQAKKVLAKSPLVEKYFYVVANEIGCYTTNSFVQKFTKKAN